MLLEGDVWSRYLNAAAGVARNGMARNAIKNLLESLLETVTITHALNRPGFALIKRAHYLRAISWLRRRALGREPEMQNWCVGDAGDYVGAN
jgi:hypothetical protein